MKQLNLKLHLLIVIACFLISNGVVAQIQLGGDILPPSSNEDYKWDACISGNGKVLAVSADGSNGHFQVLFYEWNGFAWQSAKAPIQGFAGDLFSYSIALSHSGNIVAIGSPQNDSTYINAGRVSVYKWQNNQWLRLGQHLHGDIYHANFGRQLDLNAAGDRLAVGSPWGRLPTAGLAGDVKVFEFDGSNWNPLGQTMTGVNAGDQFGFNLEINHDGNRLVVGAPNYDLGNSRNIGLARAFEYDTSTQQWVRMGSDILGNNANDYFGRAVSMSGNGQVIAAGSHNDSINMGIGYVKSFDWQTSSWVSKGQIIGSPTISGVGHQLDLDFTGHKLFDSPRSFNASAGGIVVFSSSGNSWNNSGQMRGVSPGESFGYRLECDSAGDRIMGLSVFQSGLMRVYNSANLVSLEDYGALKDTESALFPNPFETYFNIQSAKLIESIEIFNVQGQEVFSKHQIKQAALNHLSFEGMGLHFCKLTFENGDTEIIKVLKHQ